MKELLKLSLVPTAICLIAGLLLAWVYARTSEPIEQTELAAKMSAIRQVLPEYDNSPDEDRKTTAESGKDWTFYVARKGDQFVGAAFECVSTKGYGGNIRLMVGVNAEGNIQAIEILEHKETPGLGAKIVGDDFKGRFSGRSLANTKWAVVKDGGDVDAITAATISSRAVAGAVGEGVGVYLKNKSSITEKDN